MPAASAAPAAAAVAAPPAPRPAPVEAVVDPTEEKSGRKIQQRVQELRVALVRAAGRLGLRYDSEQVGQDCWFADGEGNGAAFARLSLEDVLWLG